MKIISKFIFCGLFASILLGSSCPTFPPPSNDCVFNQKLPALNFGHEMKLFWDVSQPEIIPAGFTEDYDPFGSAGDAISYLQDIVNKYPPNCNNCDEEGYIVVTVHGNPAFCDGVHEERFSYSYGNALDVSLSSIWEVTYPAAFEVLRVDVEIYSPLYDGVMSTWDVSFYDGNTSLGSQDNQLQGTWMGTGYKGGVEQIRIYVNDMFNFYTVN